MDFEEIYLINYNIGKLMSNEITDSILSLNDNLKEFSLTQKKDSDKVFELNNSYGAPEAERSYPTRIFIKMHGKEKEVI